MRIRTAAAALALVVSLGLWGKSPDIVLVSLNTFRADRLAAFGGSGGLTPNLDELAAKSTVFSGCFTTAPMALPADASLLTGCFPARTGLHDDGYGVLAPGVKTLAQVLGAEGYDARAVVGASTLDGRFGLDRGFARYDDGVGPARVRTATQVTDRAVAVLTEKRSGPLFLWVEYADAHAPYLTGPSAPGAGALSRYDRAVAHLDAELGRLFRTLPAGTILAVVSDHGESLGDHGEATHGTLLFQPTVRVVWMLCVPGRSGVRHVSEACSLADVAPTLLAAAGLKAQGSFHPDGSDLLSTPGPGRRAIPVETWFPYDNFRWSPLLAVTDGRYKWVRSSRGDRLYDLKKDPGEHHDIAKSAPRTARWLKERLPDFPSKPPAAGLPAAAASGPACPAAGALPLAPRSLRDPLGATSLLTAMNEARNTLEMGHWEQASALAASVTEKDPGNPTAWFEYAEALRREKRADDAVKADRRALAIAPRMARAYVGMGHADVSRSKPDEAARSYRAALAIEPDLTSAANALAAYYLDRNEAEKAFDLLGRAVAEGFADADTYVLKGRIHLVQKDKKAAATDFQMALQLSGNPARTLKEEADVYLLKSQFPEALHLYREGMRLYPGYAPNFLTVGTLYLQTDRPAEALPLYRKALKCDLDAATRTRVEALVRDLVSVLKQSPHKEG